MQNTEIRTEQHKNYNEEFIVLAYLENKMHHLNHWSQKNVLLVHNYGPLNSTLE
jgi:hypothetical protein